MKQLRFSTAKPDSPKSLNGRRAGAFARFTAPNDCEAHNAISRLVVILDERREESLPKRAGPYIESVVLCRRNRTLPRGHVHWVRNSIAAFSDLSPRNIATFLVGTTDNDRAKAVTEYVLDRLAIQGADRHDPMLDALGHALENSTNDGVKVAIEETLSEYGFDGFNRKLAGSERESPFAKLILTGLATAASIAVVAAAFFGLQDSGTRSLGLTLGLPLVGGLLVHASGLYLKMTRSLHKYELFTDEQTSQSASSEATQ